MVSTIVLIIFVVMKSHNDKLTLSKGEILKQYWGYDAFRPKQEEIIDSILAGHDTLALLPTGGGKSLTYQVPALMLDGVCIVITPLIALMKDQVDRLRSLSIPAVAIHSGLSMRQIDIALDNCVYGDIKFLYVSPERVATELFRMRLKRMRISMIAVDEAHCISQWGYDFRPSYLRIAELRPFVPSAPILALTASATKSVLADICLRLKFKEERIVRGSFARPNLVYVLRKVEDKEEQLLKVIGSVQGSGIVYVRTREGAEKLSNLLLERDIEATYYHGGLPHTERALRQDEWLKGEVRVMVATNAFGMGIDKPDVRFVVHYTLCDSLEYYYQEAGRAGRDGVRSYAVLLYSPQDNESIVRRFSAEFPPIKVVKEIYDKICSSLQIAIGEGELSSHIFNIFEFCSQHKIYYGTVQSALKILEANQYMSLTDEMENPARLMFCVSRDDLYKVRVDHDELDHFLRVLLRLYEGLFTEFRPINEIEIAHWSGYTVHKVKELLTRLWRMRLVRYVPSNKSPLIVLESERLPLESLYISPESYKLRQELGQERYANMLAYAQNEEQCRSSFIEEYFGATESHDCGVCDICLARKRSTKLAASTLEPQILAQLKAGNLSTKEIVAKINAPSDQIAAAVSSLLDSGTIVMGANQKLSLGE